MRLRQRCTLAHASVQRSHGVGGDPFGPGGPERRGGLSGVCQVQRVSISFGALYSGRL